MSAVGRNVKLSKRDWASALEKLDWPVG